MTGHLRQRGANSWQLIVHLRSRRAWPAALRLQDGARHQAAGRGRPRSAGRRGRRARPGANDLAAGGRGRTGWLQAKAPRLSPSTVVRYEVAIKHIFPAIGGIAVARLRPRDIEDFYARLHAEGLSGSSIRKVHWATRTSLAWAKRRGYVATLATEGVELPPLGEQPLTSPSSLDVRKLIERSLADDADFGTMLAVIAWTGCRRGEACGLRWSDIDFEAAEAPIGIADTRHAVASMSFRGRPARRSLGCRRCQWLPSVGYWSSWRRTARCQAAASSTSGAWPG